MNNPVKYVDPDGSSVDEPDDWVLGKNGKYIYDADVTSALDPDLNGRIYVGKSLNDVYENYANNNLISSILGIFGRKPKFGDTSEWPGEIMAQKNTVFENVRDLGLENNVPMSETIYNTLNDVSVFVTSFDLFSPVGQPLRLDGSVLPGGSSEHINSGINGLFTVMPMPKFNIRGFNMTQSNKFFKGTQYNKLPSKIKGKTLKIFNFIMKNNLTPKKIFKKTKSNAEKIKK